MPFPPEVNALKAEVGGKQDLIPSRQPEDCAIVPNAGNDALMSSRLAADPRDQSFFCGWQESIIFGAQELLRHKSKRHKTINNPAHKVVIPRLLQDESLPGEQLLEGYAHLAYVSRTRASGGDWLSGSRFGPAIFQVPEW